MLITERLSKSPLETVQKAFPDTADSYADCQTELGNKPKLQLRQADHRIAE